MGVGILVLLFYFPIINIIIPAILIYKERERGVFFILQCVLGAIIAASVFILCSFIAVMSLAYAPAYEELGYTIMYLWVLVVIDIIRQGKLIKAWCYAGAMVVLINIVMEFIN